MKKFCVVFAIIALVGCVRKSFDRMEPTEIERYSIAYRADRCGLYDVQADSLVTALHYDALQFGRTADEAGQVFTIWVVQKNGCQGMLAVDMQTNEIMEILFPNE